MTPSSPLRQTRRSLHLPETESNGLPVGEAAIFIARSIPMVIAAVSVIVTSNYLSYLIGRKQVTYEELRRQVDRVAKLTDGKRADGEPVTGSIKHEEKFEQNSSTLTGLTTSTINGKTTVVPALAPVADRTPAAPVSAPVQAPVAERTPAAPVDVTAVAPSPQNREVRLPPPQPTANSVPKHEVRVVSHQRVRRSKTSSTPGQTDLAFGSQSGQFKAATPAETPDAGLARQ